MQRTIDTPNLTWIMMCGQNDFYQNTKYRSSPHTIMLRSVYQRNMASTKHIFSKKGLINRKY